MSYGSVILSDDYSELSLMLPTGHVYGQGAGALSFDKNGANSNKTLLYNRWSHLFSWSHLQQEFFKGHLLIIKVDKVISTRDIKISLYGTPLYGTTPPRLLYYKSLKDQ